jgi:4-amino-4-deoxy-L-arabinose transferase-like glycosyltransferase
MQSSAETPEARETPGAKPLAWGVALALFAAGTFLRVNDFTTHPLWIDEYGTSWVVAAETWREVWWRALEIQGQSPLYYSIVRASVDLLGDGTFALRLPSLVCGIALLGMGPWLALRLFEDRRVALASLAAFAFDERLIFYSRDARPYTLALLCAVASFWFYAKLRQDDRWPSRIGWILSTAATYYVHYLFAMVLLVQGVHALVWRPQGRERLRRDAATLALLGATSTPGLWQLVHLFGRRQSLDWVPADGGAFAGLALVLEFVDLRLLGVVGAAACGALLFEGTRSLRLSRSSLGLLGLWLGIPLLLVSAAPLWLGVNLIHARYVLVLLPAVALLLGALVGLPRGARVGSCLLVVLVAAFGVLGVKPMLEGKGAFGSWHFGQNWGGATADLVGQHRGGDRVFYGTNFVELDSIVTGKAPPVMVDFASWPVRAHLPGDREFGLQALPYRYTRETRLALLETLGQAEGRVWLIGMPEPVRRALGLATRAAGFRSVAHTRHGVVHLVLLEARPDAWTPGGSIQSPE